MSIDEIRQQKALALLEFLEAEDRLATAKGELKNLSGRLAELSRLIAESDKGETIKLSDLERSADPESVRQAVAEYNDSLEALSRASKKKRELGLR